MKALILLICIIGSVVAVFASKDRTIMYRRTGIKSTSDWSPLQPAPDSAVATFTLALQQSNLDKLDTLFWDRSNPDSPNFGRYLTREQVYSAMEVDSKIDTLRFESWFLLLRKFKTKLLIGSTL